MTKEKSQDSAKPLAELLLEARQALDLTQDQMSRELGIAVRTYQSYERGEGKPTSGRMAWLKEQIQEIRQRLTDSDVDLEWIPVYRLLMGSLSGGTLTNTGVCMRLRADTAESMLGAIYPELYIIRSFARAGLALAPGYDLLCVPTEGQKIVDKSYYILEGPQGISIRRVFLQLDSVILTASGSESEEQFQTSIPMKDFLERFKLMYRVSCVAIPL